MADAPFLLKGIMDFFSLIEELLEFSYRTVHNREQCRRVFETTIMDYLYNLKEDDLPALRAAIRMSKEDF